MEAKIQKASDKKYSISQIKNSWFSIQGLWAHNVNHWDGHIDQFIADIIILVYNYISDILCTIHSWENIAAQVTGNVQILSEEYNFFVVRAPLNSGKK